MKRVCLEKKEDSRDKEEVPVKRVMRFLVETGLGRALWGKRQDVLIGSHGMVHKRKGNKKWATEGHNKWVQIRSNEMVREN